MPIELVVVSQFGAYQRGDRIVTPEEVEAVLAGDNAHRVVRTNASPAPAKE